MKSYLFNILLSCLVLPVFAQKSSLEVHIPKIKAAGEGQILIMIHRSSESFPASFSQATYSVVMADFDNKLTYTFTDIEPGTYAVSAFHDKNKNGKIDRNFIGFPKEPVAAANQKSLGRPSFSRSSLQLGKTPQRIELTFIND
ncbi:MAG: DUF2141 domain-containing protein [Bacteroidota bacterium]